MKAIQYILTVAALMLCITIHAQQITDTPPIEWQSTSAMAGSGSNLPMAAQNGVVTTYGAENMWQHNNHNGPRRVNKDDDIGDPGSVPLGDVVWPLMLCAGAFLIIRIARRKRAKIE